MSTFTVTTENLSTVARDTIVAGRRIERNYAALATFYKIDHETESKVLTETARAIVLAAYPDTDPERLSGKNKNSDQRWCDARTVRAGLVRAVKVEADDTDETETKDVKYLTAAGCKVESLSDVLAKVEAEWTAAHQTA